MGDLGDLLERTVREWQQDNRPLADGWAREGTETTLRFWVQEYVSLISKWPTSSCTEGGLKKRKDELAEAILCYMDKMDIAEIQTEHYILCRDYTNYREKPVELRASRIFRVS